MSQASPPKPPGLTVPHLKARFPDGTTGEFALGELTTLGRHPSNTLRLVDREVSKEHARIERMGRDYILRDLGSSNGTFVNGEKVKQATLKVNDALMSSVEDQPLRYVMADRMNSALKRLPVVHVALKWTARTADRE